MSFILRILLTIVFLCLYGFPYTLADTNVYVKLFPNKELCVSHFVFRDPEASPVQVGFVHRALSPRLSYIRAKLYGPSADINTRGPQIPLEDSIDTLGHLTTIYFHAEETGIYTICLKSLRQAPIMGFEITFVANNEKVDPLYLEDGTMAVDKPVGMEDYKDRLNMLKICVEETRDELRSIQVRRFMFEHTTHSIMRVTIGTLLLNMVIAAVLFLWSERYMERVFMKKKKNE
ncbi:unnamed protein product [Phytomonas sp. EM1]|nr:unnamed protein product [Phytomonas sp. EM1]|eukprot:CCW63321.1 unnamed protein product [Phytomonas sp. isolate EM1]